MKSRGSRLSIALMAVVLGVMALAPTAGATSPGVDLSIPVDTIEWRDYDGEVRELLSEPVDAEFQGQVCSVKIVGENQGSEHPNNDLIVSSGGGSVEALDVEAYAGKITEAAGELTLGDTITVSLRFGDYVFSGGMSVELDCEPVPDPVSVEVIIGACVYEDGSETPVSVAVTPAGGASVVVSDGGGDVATLGDGESVDVAPGDYSWAATAAEGYVLEGDTEGEFTAEDCTPVTTTTTEATTTTTEATTTTTEATTTTTDEVLGTTITVAPTTVVVDSTLPFTGFENEQMVGIAIMLLGSGILLTLFARGRREES